MSSDEKLIVDNVCLAPTVHQHRFLMFPTVGIKEASCRYFTSRQSPRRKYHIYFRIFLFFDLQFRSQAIFDSCHSASMLGIVTFLCIQIYLNNSSLRSGTHSMQSSLRAVALERPTQIRLHAEREW